MLCSSRSETNPRCNGCIFCDPHPCPTGCGRLTALPDSLCVSCQASFMFTGQRALSLPAHLTVVQPRELHCFHAEDGSHCPTGEASPSAICSCFTTTITVT